MKTKSKLLMAALSVSLMAGGALMPSAAMAQEEIKFYFPTSVQGALALLMKDVVARYNDSQDDVEVTAVYTGSYAETGIKSICCNGSG